MERDNFAPREGRRETPLNDIGPTNLSLVIPDWVSYISAARTAYCGHGLLVQTMRSVLVPIQTLMRQTNAVNASIHTDEIAFTVAMFPLATGHTSRICVDFLTILQYSHSSNMCP